MIISPKKSLARGAFIVFEGPDRSGKSTQSKLLLQNLSNRNIPSEFMRFPDRNASNEFGTRISKYLSKELQLSKEEAHTIFTLQRFHERERMENYLLEGKNVIVDRYSHSGVAYSVAKGLDIEWCMAQETGLVQPDIVIYLDISPEDAGKRGGFGDELFETSEFQKKVCEAYKSLWRKSWRIIDATLPSDKVFPLVLDAAMTAIRECKQQPVRHLWSEDILENSSHGFPSCSV